MVKVSLTLKNRHFFNVMQFFTLWVGKVWSFLRSQMKFRSILGKVEYSEGSNNFIVEKYKISAFKRRVWNFHTTSKKINTRLFRKKNYKKNRLIKVLTGASLSYGKLPKVIALRSPQIALECCTIWNFTWTTQLEGALKVF